MDDRFLQDLKQRVDLVALIGKYTELKKSGKNYMARSPFRNERTPSFSVSPDKQVWYDFGASEGGDAISFIEKIENVSFPEAIEILADGVGIEVPKNQKPNPKNKQQKKDIYQLHQVATAYFMSQLEKVKKASDYLDHRGLGSIADHWQLGYGGESKDGLSKHLLKQGFSEKLISESGVAFERSFGDKSIQDRFWGRVMIPITEPRNGDIIAFSGRDILDRKKVGKYINSPENPVYHKSSTLFGLYQARKAIREKDQVILVEGNFDVVTMHEKGFDQTVATCGTALTQDHLRILKRLTSRIILAFDTDLAGKKATLRSMEMILLSDLHPFILEFSEGKDIDEFLQKHDAKVLEDQLKQPKNALEFLLEKLLGKFLPQGVEGRKKILSQFFYFLNVCPRPMEIDYFLGLLAERLNTGKSIMVSEFEKYQSNHQKPDPSALKPKETTVKRLEKSDYLVGFLWSHWEILSLVLGEDSEIASDLIDLLETGKAKEFLKNLLEGKDLNPEDQLILESWAMASENQSGEAILDESSIKETFMTMIAGLKREDDKRKRTEEAKALGVQLRG